MKVLLKPFITLIIWLITIIQKLLITTTTIGKLYEDSTNNETINTISPNNKITNTYKLKTTYISTDTGFKPVNQIHKTKPFKVYEIHTKNGLTLQGADEHILLDENMNNIWIKDLKIGSLVQTENGIDKIINIIIHDRYEEMYDVTVNSKEHRFYSNGFLSHNTTTAGIFLAWFLCFHKDKSAMLLANKGETVKEIVDKTQKIIMYLPFFLKPGVLNKTQRSLVLDNGSRIKSQATTKTSSIGDTVDLLYIDEFAYIDPSFAHEFWRQVLPTTSKKNSRVILTSTPNGRNLFYEIYKAALEKKNTFKPYRVDWWQVPGRDETWKKETIANLANGNLERGEEDFNQQYGCQFLTSASLLLKAKQLDKWDKRKKAYKCLSIDKFDEMKEPLDYQYLKWIDKFDLGTIKKRFFILSIDIGEGLGQDYSVLNIFEVILRRDWDKLVYKENVFSIYDFFFLKQVGIFRDDKTSLDDFCKIIYHTTKDLFNRNNIKVVLEWNNYGRDMYSRLGSLYGDDNDFDPSIIIKYKHTLYSKYKKAGLKITKGNKSLFCFDFKEQAAKGYIELNEYNSLEEAATFGRNKNGNYEGQMGNDDIIMSAVNATTSLHTNAYKSLVEDRLDSMSKIIRKNIDLILDGRRNISEKVIKDDKDMYAIFNEKQTYHGLVSNNSINKNQLLDAIV